MYDPSIGRFPSVDPIIEKFPHLTPYNYASNDPASKIDLWGLQGMYPHILRQRGALSDIDGDGKVSAGEKKARTEVLKEVVNTVVDEIPIVGEVKAYVEGGLPELVAGLIPFGRKGKRLAKQLKKNKVAGKKFEKKVGGDLEAGGHTNIEKEITIKASDGTKTRLDFVSEKNGKIKLTEAKSSQSAPLTGNQKVAHPQISTTGGVVVGKGKGKFKGGTKIPPTKVDVVRPPKKN